jgi:hypothetical protein
MPKREGAAHVVTTRRAYKGKVYETHLLRRTFREGAKVRNVTLANLSHLLKEVIEIIRRALKGERFVSATEAFKIVRTRAHGHVAAVVGMIQRLGLDTLVDTSKTASWYSTTSPPPTSRAAAALSLASGTTETARRVSSRSSSGS